MTSEEWAALPVEIRMWAIESALTHLKDMPIQLDEQARFIAEVLMDGTPALPEEEVPEGPPKRSWRQERGLG